MNRAASCSTLSTQPKTEQDKCQECGASPLETHRRNCSGGAIWPEDRMDIIGANGPTGEHYRELNPASSSLTHSEAITAAKETGLCSDGSPCGSPHDPGEDMYCDECPNRPGATGSSLSRVMREGMERAAVKWGRGEMDAAPQHSYLTSGDASKYHREIKPGVWVDVYSVLVAFGVTNPADAHAIKKMLMPGRRGAKCANQDRQEAIASLRRAIELEAAE